MIKYNFKNINKIQTIQSSNSMIEKEKLLKKPEWLKIRLPVDFGHFNKLKTKISRNGIHSVCEEASCPNITKCFNKGTATFMILGNICTRRCPFCNVKHGRPFSPDPNEPLNLANTIASMGLRYVVITSVNRDDLRDGGAQHFTECIYAIRKKNPKIKIEILVPDFRGCMNQALEIIKNALPDVFNHNLESIPRLYFQVRPGANYSWSLKLLKRFKEEHPEIKTKSGLMVGLGETIDEIIKVIYDLYNNGVTMLTVGQYLQPSRYHLPVKKYLTPNEFDKIKIKALSIGFTHVTCGPLIRSSYYAEMQEMGKEVV